MIALGRIASVNANVKASPRSISDWHWRFGVGLNGKIGGEGGSRANGQESCSRKKYFQNSPQID